MIMTIQMIAAFYPLLRFNCRHIFNTEGDFGGEFVWKLHQTRNGNIWLAIEMH